MGCQSSKQTTITTPPPSSTHLPSHPLPTLYEEPSTEVEHVPRSPPPISTKSSSSSTPNHSNLSSPKQKNSLQSKPSHHSQVENRPIKLVGNLSNPILLQILQVVCSEKSYHESIHRIHIDKVMQKQDYISCEICGDKRDQTIFLSYLCLLSKAVPVDEETTIPDFLPPLIPLEDCAMIASIVDDSQLHCEFIVNYFYSDLIKISDSLGNALLEYLPTLIQWIQPTPETDTIKTILSHLSISVELYSNQLHSDFTHILLSFSYHEDHSPDTTTTTGNTSTPPSSELKSLCQQTIFLALKNILKYCCSSSNLSHIPTPPSPFDRILSQYSMTTSFCYPYTLLLLYGKRFILSTWKGLQAPSISSGSTLLTIHDLTFTCQCPMEADASLCLEEGEIEILNEYSIAFQRFLNGFRYHHYSQSSISNLEDDNQPTIPLISSESLLQYIHQFGTSDIPSESSPIYSFGYHGTNFIPNIQSIFFHGFNPLQRNAQLFGPGEYFSRPGYEECAAIYSGRTNSLILSAVMISDELQASPSSPPSSPSSMTISPPYYVIPNPNPKYYGVTGRNQQTHDYFTYCMPLILVNWKKDPVYDENGQVNLNEEAEEWIFDYNHHKDPKELIESFPSIYSPSVERADSESGIWTNKSYLTEESHQYSAKSSQYYEGGESLPLPEPSRELLPQPTSSSESTAPPPPPTTTTTTPHPNQRRLLSSLNSYQFDSDEEGYENKLDGDGISDTSPISSMKPPLHPRNQLESTRSITSNPRYSRSYSTQEDDEDDERKYAVLKLKSLIKKQETFSEEKPTLDRAHSHAWFDSIF